MPRRFLVPSLAVAFVVAWLSCRASTARAGDWRQFRGPGGLGISEETGLPVHWSASENVRWRTPLPGAGTSSPITLADRVYVTCYSGYAVDSAAPGDMNDLRRHLLYLDRASGTILWQKDFDPALPEHQYAGEGAYHGYASSTPATDGERLWVFFGKSGLYCFDLDGNELWHADVGEGTNGWGSGTSPLLYRDLVIVNASVECGELIAFDKETGSQKWRAGGVSAAWNTPLLAEAGGETELVVSVQGQILGFQPETGEPLWNADGVHRYVCPSVVAAEGTIFAIGGGHTSLAVRGGGRGDVTASHGLWREGRGSNVSSPIVYEGHLYWASDSGGVVFCQNAATGETLFDEPLSPESGLIYASPILSDGKLYFVSQRNGTYVVAAKPEYELLAHNVFEDDDSRTNASPAASDGALFLRNDRYLYCIAADSRPAAP